MYNRTYYAVLTEHPIKGSKWDGQHTFRVSADKRPEGLYYYARAEGFGCGKSCRTPGDAIRQLANDNAAEVIELSILYEDEI